MNLQVKSTQAREIIDLTDLVASLLGGKADGVAVVNAPHTTVALFVSELDQDLERDYMKVADHLLAAARPFAHARNDNRNTEAHVLSAMFGTSVTLPVAEGKLSLGTYQRLLFFELDGPKTRTVSVTYLGGRT